MLSASKRIYKPLFATASRNYTAPIRDMKFLIYDVYNVEAHYAKVKKQYILILYILLYE